MLMLKSILLTLMFFAFANLTCAQKLTPNSIINTKTGSFVTKQDPSYSDDMVVVNSKNIYHKINPKTGPANISSVERRDKSGLLNSFTQVFSDERLTQLLPEKYMLMTLYVNPAGKVLEVTFYLKKTTVIEAKELEELENAIKANVSFKLLPNETKGGDFFPIGQIVKYSRVLDRTLK